MIPQGWEEKTLHEVLNKVKYTSKIQSKLYKDKGKHPIISQEDVFISGYWDNPSDVYHVKHPIVIFGDHTKVVKYIDFDFVLGADGVKILDPTKDINAKFLYYWTKYVPLRNLGYARHYKLLSEKTIHFPPLPEQQRIVAKLDKAFEAIDKVKAKAEQNLNNAKELFESTLNNWMNKFEKQPTISLINAYNFIDYRGVTPNKISSGVPLVTAKNVKMGYIDYTIKDFISEKDYNMRQSRGISRKGDILFTTEAPLGNVALADLDKFSAGQRIITFQQYENSKYHLNNVFYCYFMRSKTFQNTIHSLATGATAQGIKASRLKFVNIPLVPSSEQQKIVEKLDALQEQTKQLEAIYTKKIKECDELKQSILQKAFRGEL